MAVNMGMEMPFAAKARVEESLRKARDSEELTASGVGNGHVVYSLDMGSLAQLLDRGDEASGARVQSVLWQGLVIGLAPCDSFGMLLGSVSGGFTIGNKP